ncbi:uncharacterized protein B0I36DRAFT_295675 [Microdochium trichocladiopsis]|uniref:Uncharacterized protein n=1 Tax=Microdochium trichocladiopsis TaxID=1682393 RepID=A0A9P8Y167_9PEZI|nr:uncharacterized protein B0I36DRAFT_295675 [Microdochium trichocladiopsis]KAH7024937.1 hypothetical protein B0I36DRAFT_295675 [Microdochium trichocladiopsis]
MKSIISVVAAGALFFTNTVAQALPPFNPPGAAINFKAVVLFGDSYTDIGTRQYRPRPETGAGDTAKGASGGRMWPQYVQQYSGARIYSYAIAASMCTNAFSPTSGRKTIQQDQIPSFLADYKARSATTGQPILDVPAETTLYAIWIGTNDVGPSGFLTDQQQPGLRLPALPDCVYAQIDTLWRDAGARHFVLMNTPPLHLAPQYQPLERGGNGFMAQFDSNLTRSTEKVRNYVGLVNSLYDWRSGYHVLVGKRWAGSTLAVFDVEALMTDVYNNPGLYLNGTAARPQSQGSAVQCGSACTDATVQAQNIRDSYMWYDGLHPTEQTGRVIAREFINVQKGNSKWARYWGF